MPDRIEVTVTPTTFTVTAGHTVEATATLRNLGQTVDQFTLSIDGLDSGWFTLPVSSVALFPNDQDNLRIILHPPEMAESGADSYPFQVKVSSQEDPEEIATVDLSIETQVLPGLGLDISPQRITGRKGTYQITINNPGDSEATLHLRASDSQGILRYSLEPESLTVPGASRSEATLEVRLGWLAFLGGTKELAFQVLASLPQGGQAKTIDGQLVRIPWHKTLPQVRLPQIRLPWLTRPPVIDSFRTTTDDKREFMLRWSVKRATEVTLNDEPVESQGEKLIVPTEPANYVLTVSSKHGSSSQTVNVQPLPVPEAKASERIRVSPSSTQLQAQAGGAPAPVTLQVQNLGEIVDKFLVEIEGLDESWHSRSASSIALMPQATDQVQISFHPPKKKGVKARAYPFAITVRSQSVSEEATSIVGQLEVLPSVEFKVGVHPYRVSARRKGRYLVNLANNGVSDISFSLMATDMDEGLRLRFDNENPEVTAWNTIEVPMMAKPKRGSIIGERKRYDITVTATSADGNTQSINCELNHSPLISSWRPIIRVVRAILVLAAVGVLIGFVLHWGGGFRLLTSSPQTWWNQLVQTFGGWFSR
jgi:uncharacterized membrane protein